MIISLTGFMGCGKSSIGRRLSELLCCSFIDLDDVIEAKAGKGIPVIFENDGEAAFREMELEELRNITGNVKDTAVLSLGGGTVTTDGCAEIIRKERNNELTLSFTYYCSTSTCNKRLYNC